MKRLHYLFTFLLISTLAFTGCKNDDDDVVADPVIKPGSIKAMVSPPNSATNMRATQGSVTKEVTPDAAGVFQINDLVPGSYSVTFTPATGFQAPPARNVTVTSDNVTDLGTITLTQPGNQFLGSFSATVDGKGWNSTIHGARLDTTSLTITGTMINMAGGIPSSTELIILTLTNVTGPGTFNGPSNAIGIVTSASLMGGTQNNWASFGPGSNCTVTLTKFDQATKKVSGTFSFRANADPTSGASGIKTVTGGTFTDLNIQ